MSSLAATATNGEESSNCIQRIGIIGGGAAGLATARAFLRANDAAATQNGDKNQQQFEVTVFETRHSIGGIWKYDEQSSTAKDGKKSRPMYRNLRTNLPKELMAFREYPFGKSDGVEASYVTHKQVQEYLEGYAQQFDLLDKIQFGCKVDQLKILDDSNNDESASAGSWPKISLEWTNSRSNDSHNNPDTQKQIFDNVCICNGHYDLPSIPPLRGLDENFQGRTIHAIEYDTPEEFIGQTVLCVGARASGADIAREIGLVANRVYLSDSTCDAMQEFGEDNTVVLMPRTQFVDEDGGIHFFSPSPNNGSGSSSSNSECVVKDIDVIIFCSGYDYSFPFINEDSNLELKVITGERRVQPLYEQLWHANYPSLSFIGLPHSVVPFPLFEIQSSAVVSQLLSSKSNASNGGSSSSSVALPALSERMECAQTHAASGGPASPGRVQDTHFLGSYQWDYCRKIAKMIDNGYDEDMENYIATNKALYDRSGMERKGMIPGGDDLYRETRFRRVDEEQKYEILYSKIGEVVKQSV